MSVSPMPIHHSPPPSYDEAMFPDAPSSPKDRSRSPSPKPGPHQPPIRRQPDQYDNEPGVGLFVLDTSEPIHTTCPYCRQSIWTTVVGRYSPIAFLIALCLCFVGLPCCCIIPFFLPDCMDFEHMCPHCHHPLNVQERRFLYY